MAAAGKGTKYLPAYHRVTPDETTGECIFDEDRPIVDDDVDTRTRVASLQALTARADDDAAALVRRAVERRDREGNSRSRIDG